jgi:LPS sulfotransferase NodH
MGRSWQTMLKPSLNYVICTAPRTGSTLLSEALASTNIAGRPNEYFDIYDDNEEFWKRSLGIRSDAEYFDRVVDATTTPNGVFGIKLLWHQSPAILAKLKVSLGRLSGAKDDRTLHEMLTEKLGEPRYIWLRRENKIAQAISYYRASRTGLWRSFDTRTSVHEAAERELPFDYGMINQYLQVVNQSNAGWRTYFQHHRVKVLMIVYEKFVQNYEPTVHSVLEFLGIERAGVSVAPPRLQRQSAPRSLEWEQRFREIRKWGVPAPKPQSAPPGQVAPDGQPDSSLTQATKARPKRAPARPAEPPLPLVAYAIAPKRGDLVTARPSRDWMDALPKRFGYRCLPMVMANQAGWMILNRHKIAVTWNGGVEPNALKIDFLSGQDPRSAVSIFGCGILTFMMGYLFRTPPGYNIYVHGPANAPKDGIAALEGIVESDWTEATFTMNWKVTRTNHPLVFEEGEPIAMVTPMPRHQLERFQPEIRSISEDPELQALHREWANSRERHNAEVRIPNSKAQQAGWQRHYMRGTSIRAEPAPEHQTSLPLGDFVDKRR